MWIWIFRIASFAASINARRSFILFVIALIKQFDRSIVKTATQTRLNRAGRSGFVYVIRDRANGERFKTGYRARPPWRDSQLRSQMGQDQDFILIIPAKDASALEKRLRRAYSNGNKRGEWFTVSDGKRREILVIAALIQVISGNDLGMSDIDPEIIRVATELWNQLQSWAGVLLAMRKGAHKRHDVEDGASKYEPDLDDFSAIPEMDWEWESVLDDNYRDLPKEKGRSGYISIIRDNVDRKGKIFFDNHPVESIEIAISEKWRQFPLEIVLVLKVDNMNRAVESLLSPSERKRGTDWIELTKEELGEIKQSAKEDYVHGSIYVSPKTHWGLKTLDVDKYRDFPKLEKPAGYVCVVQGVNPGSLYKIWETSHPKGLVDDRWQSRELNNLHDMLTASKPIKFYVIVKCKFAGSFREFLQERYHERRRHMGWFELNNRHLTEIKGFGN